LRTRRLSPVLGGAAGALLPAVLLAGMPAARLGAQQLPRPEVTAVRFEGNRTFPPDSLARAIVTRATECRYLIYRPLCWAGVDFALQRAYLPRREFPGGTSSGASVGR